MGARAAFYDLGIAKTHRRSGLLVFVGMYENSVLFVPDAGVDKKALLELAPARTALEKAVAERDLAGFLKSLELIAAPLEKAMPRKAGDENELPDEPHMSFDLHHVDLHHLFEELIRPGGGQSYSGSRSSGGGGGGLSLERRILEQRWRRWRRVLFPAHPARLSLSGHRHPAHHHRRDRDRRSLAHERGRDAHGWASQDLSSVAFEPPEEEQDVAATTGVPRRTLDRIRETDPDFSIVLFEDFLYTLYAEMMRARGQQGAMQLAAYLSPAVQQVLVAKSLSQVSGIVIGAMRVSSIDRTQTSWRVTLDFEANITEANQRLYVVDRMTVERNVNAKSRPPARSRTLDCPNCGAPLNNLRGDTCTYCKQQVGMGRFDWSVVYFERLQSENRGPLLTSDVEETGTDAPTIVDPMSQQELANLRGRDPSFDWNAFQQRVGLAFNEMQTGWSNRDLSKVRPFVSDNLFQTQAYWIDLYTQARARNITEGARIGRIDLANVICDKYFDAITIRLFASSTDYTIGDDGKLLSGNKSRQRQYSEYWTWIRGAGKPADGPDEDHARLPELRRAAPDQSGGVCSTAR